MLIRLNLFARLTPSQEDLEASRERHDQATGSAVSSALGHRQKVEPKKRVAVSLPSVGPAGSIFSNERVVFPSPVERPAAEIVIPGMRQLKPTPPRSVDTSKFEASGPTEIYEPHDIFRDPAHANFAKLRDYGDMLSRDADIFDHRYILEHERNNTFDQFTEVITSYSDSLENYPPMPRSEACLTIVDRMMQGDGDMALFGRWRHRKDAPLEFVKDMIDRDLRGPGACSLYGPGGLRIEDHPLVCLYNERVEKLREEGSSTLQEPKTPLLSPILLQGNSASQRLSMRSSTPITFSMSEDGTFQTTGFQMRTASTGSSVESISPIESSDLASLNAQEHARRDSGVHGLRPDTSMKKVLDTTGHRSLGNYEILRYYSPDPALDHKAINDETTPKYRREQRAMCAPTYVRKWCGGYNYSMRPPTRARLPPQQGPHAQQQQQMSLGPNTQIHAHQSTPHDHNTDQTKLGHDLQLYHSRRHGQLEQRDYTAHQQNNALPTSQQQHQKPPPSTRPCQVSEVKQHQQRPPSAQLCQISEVKQQKHVRLDESKNVSRIIPCPVTIVAPEDAENAMFSEDEDTVVDTHEAPNNNAATNPSQSGSLSTKGLLNGKSLTNAPPGTHRTMQMPRSILKTSSSYAAASTSSSAVSAAAKDLNTSTELTPTHATPGTTASSGRDYQISASACARSITRRLDERLKQTETHTSNKAISP